MLNHLFKSKLDHIDTCLNPDPKLLHPLLKDYTEPYNERVYNDLEIFKDYDNNEIDTLFSVINKTFTLSGSIKLQNMFMKPQDHSKLKAGYKLLNKHSDKVRDSLIKLSILEKSLLVYCKDDANINELLTNITITIPYVNKLNENEAFMNLYNNYHIFSPLFTAISPLILFVLTFLFSRFAFFKYVDYISFNIPKTNMFANGNYLSGLISIAMYIFSLYTASLYSIVNQKLLRKMYEFNSHIAKTQTLIQELETTLHDFFDLNSDSYTFLKTKFYDRPYKIISNKGKIIKDFFKIKNNIEPIKQMLANLGKLDAHFNNLQLGISPEFCFSNIVPYKKPLIIAKDLYLPNTKITAIKNTKNNIYINGTNLIVTGANAQGKSTFLKSMAASIILSQQLAIAPCTTFSHTRFKYIETYLNIHDKKGEKSFYETELEIMNSYIENLEKQPKNEFSFIVIDEMFSGTNPNDAISASIAIAEKMETFKNNVAIITTHHHQLNQLDNFKKYHMLNYRLKLGANKTTNGIDILKTKNFDSSVVKRAEELKKNI